MRSRKWVAVALVIVLLAAAGLATGWYVLDDDPRAPDDSAVDPTSAPPPPGIELPPARPATLVLSGPVGPRVDPRAVRAALTPLLADPDLGRHVGIGVRDLTHDRTVLRTGDRGPFIPASTLKLLVSAAALAELGPEHRFETTVRLEDAGRGPPIVVLVGGGDPLLARTSADPQAADVPDVSRLAAIDQLARRAATALGDADVDRVRVGWDASLFTGPSVAPSWEPSYVPEEIVSPVSALWVDEGLDSSGAGRSAAPAAAAARELANALQRAGVAVVDRPTSASGANGQSIASALSAPLDEIVTHVLETSDNEAAEVLLRHVALATDRPASFTGGGAAVRETLTGLGVPWDDVVVRDGSGLSRTDAVTLPALLAVLGLGADPQHPELRTVLSGLPVARFSGSLAYRFLGPGTAAGRGIVRAKTGTLTGVHGLAGVVVARAGVLLAFALLTDRVRPVDTLDARATLDRLAAALAGCGCR